MTTYQILCLIGIPSIVSALIGYLFAMVKKSKHEIKALKSGVQALLRDRLYQLYNHCNSKGFADDAERSNFANMYNQYHNLGANGVMDDYKEKVLDLPLH